MLCQSQEWNLFDETTNSSPSVRPELPWFWCKFYCIFFVCPALASTGSMLTAAPNAALGNKVLVEEPHSSSAAGPFQAMLTENVPQLFFPKSTPEKNYFSTSWYSQAGLEVLTSDLFDYSQFQSLPITVPWNYSKPFLFFFFKLHPI